MNTDIISKLNQLNLSINEAKIYSVLTELNQTSAGNIIKRTQLHRSVVYETLDKLIDKKMVFKVTKKKIAYYQTTDPNIFIDRAKEQEKIATEIVPLLKKMGGENLPEISIYEGIESYRKYWVESLRRLPHNSIDCVAGSIGSKWWEWLGPEMKNYQKLMVEKRLKWKVLVYKMTDKEMEFWRQHPKQHEYRMIEREVDFDGNFNIFNDDILVLHSAAEPMIIEIKNKTLVKVFKNIFEILWEMAKPIKLK